MKQLAPVALGSILIPVVASAQSFVVDGAGSGDFTNIQSAVDAAPSGSTLFVVGGAGPAYSYDSFRIDSKSLTLVGLGAAPVEVELARVNDLASPQEVVLRNFRFSEPGHPAPRLEVTECEGTVRLHGCELTADARYNLESNPILDVGDSANVTLDRCIVDGGFSFRPGAWITRSRVTATRSSFIAGSSIEVPNPSSVAQDALHGRDGITVVGRSFLWLGDCFVEGGDGEIVRNVYAGVSVGNGGDGGTGIDVAPGALCFRLDTSVVPGDPTYNFPWSGQTGLNLGAPGEDVVGMSPIVPGEQRSLDAVDPTPPSDQPIRLRVVGLPGEHVMVLGSRQVFFRFLGPLYGVFGLFAPDPGLTMDAGTIPASGFLAFDYDPALPTGSAVDRFDLTVLCMSAPNRFRISNVESIVRKDPN